MAFARFTIEAARHVDFSLERSNAEALVALFTRLDWEDARRLAVDDDEADRMVHAVEILKLALTDAGVMTSGGPR
jgi:hypothetical protein